MHLEMMIAIAENLTDATPPKLATIGLTVEDYQLLRQRAPHNPADRTRVCNTVQSLVYGSLDLAGLPRYSFPAEYQAVIISVLAQRINWAPICYNIATDPTFAAILAGREGQEATSPAQLFAAVLALSGGVDITAISQSVDAHYSVVVEQIKQPPAGTPVAEGPPDVL